MALLERLNVDQAGASITPVAPTALFTAGASGYLVSVVATNTVPTNGWVSVYVAPEDTETTGDWGVIAYRLPISGYDSYETFRFAINVTDVVYVEGELGVTFYAQGIEQVSA